MRKIICPVIALCLIVAGWIPAATHAAKKSRPKDVERQVAELAESVKELLPVWHRRMHILSQTWEVVDSADNAIVVAGDLSAYRVLLRQTIREFAGMVSQRAWSDAEWAACYDQRPEEFRPKYDHIELYLFPSEQALPVNLSSSIPWAECDRLKFGYTSCLGEGHGFTWFARGPLEYEFLIRDQLALEGGDDPLQLAVKGLTVEDPCEHREHMTAQFCRAQLIGAGEKAIPYLAWVAQMYDGYAQEHAARALGFIPGGRTTELLLVLFDSDDPEVARGTRYGLFVKPYREAAKRAYLQMLQESCERGELHSQAAAACVEFGWKEAIPALDAICSRPKGHWDYLAAYEYRLALRGVPKPRVGKGMSLKDRKAAILACEDKELAVFLALELALQVEKGGAQAENQAGRDVLQQLPRDVSVRVVSSLAESAAGRWEKKRLEEILALLQGEEGMPGR
ncbi:MAG: hypothetical protein GY851_19860 [bacterium]|nr:hypothetical protein [bacterium]